MADMDQHEWQRRVDSIIETEPLTPGRGKVIVARDPKTTKLSSDVDLVRPDSHAITPQTGTIVALGERRENAMGTPVDFVFGRGDRVIINEMAGKKLVWYELEMAVLEEDEVVVKMNSMKAETQKL